MRRPERVSIHAPAWGATSMVRATMARVCWFQSTHPRGVRHHQLSKRDAQLFLFQSTHPRGVRRRILFALQAAGRGFNPRTRVGCDHKTASDGALRMRFNPRTRVGCDAQIPSRALSGSPCFNPRTRVGCDPALSFTVTPSFCFNPRTRVGCDRYRAPADSNPDCFNPRTRVGCDIEEAHDLHMQVLFQSTHPRGVRRDGSTTTVQKADPWVSIHAPAWGATFRSSPAI